MTQEETFDVLVVGSGAGGLLSALRARTLGLSVLVIEKGSQLGGASAKSGAGIWIPQNHLMADEGITDSREDAFQYLKTLIGDQVSDERISAYIDHAPKMLHFLMKSSPVQYVPVAAYPDYYPSVKGWKSGGRTLDPIPIDGRVLGKSLYDIVEAPRQSKAMGLVSMSILEGSAILATLPGWKKTLGKIFFKYFLDIPGRLRGLRDRRLTQGNALIGGLWMELRKLGVEIRLNCPVTELIHENERVAGLMVEQDGNPIRIKANRGVVVAAGGFEANQEMREKYLPNPTDSSWSAGNPLNTGDLIRQSMDIGASVSLMEECWWAPVFEAGGYENNFVLFSEKSKPGMILVDKNGQRFMNEATTYNSYGEEFHNAKKKGHDCFPAYAIFDGRYRESYMFGPLLQRSYTPDWMHKDLFNNGKIVKANSLEELAQKLGIESTGLVATAERIKQFSEKGVDEDFHRGDDDHDRYYGDQNIGPNPCLAPLDTPPFYGAKVHPGDIGTKGGLDTNANGQVLDKNHCPIAGLYAIGNSSSSVMGDKYPGAGCTLGPAMVFGYLAAQHMAEVSDA